MKRSNKWSQLHLTQTVNLTQINNISMIIQKYQYDHIWTIATFFFLKTNEKSKSSMTITMKYVKIQLSVLSLDSPVT